MSAARSFVLLAFLLPGLVPGLLAQEAFVSGAPLDLRPNTRVFGGFFFAESCSYDPVRDLYVTPNAGNRGPGFENDGYVSLVHPDGSVHTLRWIGETRSGLTLHDPLGSDIEGGILYLADGNAVRSFDLGTGTPGRAVVVEGATGFNDIEVGPDGTIFATQTRAPERIYRILPDGTASILVDGPPLSGPNGIAFDPDGNLVVVNVASADVLTLSPSGELLRTEQAHDDGNDGIVVLPDGTKYVSSVRFGSISRIRPGREAEVIATGIPSAASMCYDSRQNQLVIPMNNHNAMAFISLE